MPLRRAPMLRISPVASTWLHQSAAGRVRPPASSIRAENSPASAMVTGAVARSFGPSRRISSATVCGGLPTKALAIASHSGSSAPESGTPRWR